MKILIAGGTGLIGARLVNSLILQNHTIVVLSRNPSKHIKKFDSQVSLVDWESNDIELLKNIDAVVKLSGESVAQLWSPKVKQLNVNSNFSALFYNPDTKIQLRFSGTTNILHKDESTQKRWIGISNSSRRCYLGPYSPSSTIEEDHPNIPDEFRFGDPKIEETEKGFENFVIVQCKFTSIDYLSLKYSGHSRCRFDFIGKNVSVCWLAP